MPPPPTWQLIDSAFPSGGFAHSAGLEAAWQSGEVPTESALDQFVRDVLWQAGHSILPLVSDAHRAPDRLEELDALCDAFLTNAVANRASRAQGRAFLGACARIWPSRDLASIEARTHVLPRHCAPISGAVLRALSVPLDAAQEIVLFVTCRSILAAAIRLGIVGPYRAQRMQYECGGHLVDVLRRCRALRSEQLTQTAPLLDMYQSTHDRLYSRLFQS
jgi:urease accessory protein